MSILSVDNISPIGSGTSVTVNSAATLVLNNANSTGIITAHHIKSNVGTFLSDVSVAGDFQIPDVIKHEGDVNTKIRFPANDTITAETAGSERIRITSDGKVGINQTSPAAMLQVDYDEGSSEVGLRLRAYNASGSKTWQLSEINGNAGVFTIRNATNGVNGLSINADGSISKPLNPAFYAYLTTNNAVYSAGTIVPWDGTHIDTRSAFQTSGSDQGRFIVPTTGIYYFGWRLNRRNDSRFDLGIFQNGTMKYLDEMRWEGTAGMWMAESGHYLLSCTAGQKIDLRVNSVNNAGSGQFDGGGNGYFDGFFGWMIG